MARLASRQTRKEKAVVDISLISNSDMWTCQHIDLAKKLFQHQQRNYIQVIDIFVCYF